MGADVVRIAFSIEVIMCMCVGHEEHADWAGWSWGQKPAKGQSLAYRSLAQARIK